MVFWMMAVTALLAAGAAQAEWTEPVLLEEGTTPCLSSDGLTIYFRRNNASGLRQIVEAAIEQPWSDGVVKVARKEDLIWMKQQRGSDQDRVDIRKLEDDAN